MRRKFIIVGGIALVSATLITLFFYNLLSDQLGRTAPESDTRSVVVAAHDLPRGALLKAGMLQVRKVPSGEAPDDGYADVSTLEGRRLIQSVAAEAPLLPKHVPKGGDQGLGVAIPPGMRAVTVHLDEYGGIHGVVTTGDRVDVLVASAARAPGRPDISLRTLLQNVEVLATDRLLDDERRNRLKANVTLLVEAPAVAELSLADQAGEIRLVLRNPDDSDTIASAGTANAREVLDLPANSYRRAAPRRMPVTRPKTEPAAQPAEQSTLARMDTPARPSSPQPVVTLHLRLAGLGDKALAEMTKGLETVDTKSPLLIARFRQGWDAEEVFERLERDGALQVFASPTFSLSNGRGGAYEQSSATPAISTAKADLDRVGVRVHFGAELGAPGSLLLDVAAQAVLQDPDHTGGAAARMAVRKAESEIVLSDRQSFWVRGLIDRPGAWDLLRQLFPQHPLDRDRNDELVILVTPRLLDAGAQRLTAAVVETAGAEK